MYPSLHSFGCMPVGKEEGEGVVDCWEGHFFGAEMWAQDQGEETIRE